MVPPATDRALDVQHGIRLEYLTLGWNILEGVVAVTAGIFAGSIALVGFGVDSAIESSSGGILLWRLRAESHGHSIQEVENRALKLVGISFLSLGAYVAYGAMSTLLTHEQPHASVAGIMLAALSLAVMPLLAWAKRRTAAKLNSTALHADSRQTSLCAYLSAILLAGLLLNALAGWWWADPVAALAMVPIIANEGRKAMRGDRCCE
jgi:divalent metal cation (Fe/Co/Zn/Cd) transporter